MKSKTRVLKLEHSHRTWTGVDGRTIRYCLRCGASDGSPRHAEGCRSVELVSDSEGTAGPALCEHSNVDTLKFCGDLWWWFHESDSSAGLRSSMGGQIDALELGVEIHDGKGEPDILLPAARKLRRMYDLLRTMSERDYGTLRAWYTERKSNASETAVARAHKAYYETRGRQ